MGWTTGGRLTPRCGALRHARHLPTFHTRPFNTSPVCSLPILYYLQLCVPLFLPCAATTPLPFSCATITCAMLPYLPPFLAACHCHCLCLPFMTWTSWAADISCTRAGCASRWHRACYCCLTAYTCSGARLLPAAYGWCIRSQLVARIRGSSPHCRAHACLSHTHTQHTLPLLSRCNAVRDAYAPVPACLRRLSTCPPRLRMPD